MSAALAASTTSSSLASTRPYLPRNSQVMRLCIASATKKKQSSRGQVTVPDVVLDVMVEESGVLRHYPNHITKRSLGDLQYKQVANDS